LTALRSPRNKNAVTVRRQLPRLSVCFFYDVLDDFGHEAQSIKHDPIIIKAMILTEPSGWRLIALRGRG
jgi:hypothetical protein